MPKTINNKIRPFVKLLNVKILSYARSIPIPLAKMPNGYYNKKLPLAEA